MNIFCLLEGTHNGPNHHVILAPVALRQLDHQPAKRIWARWQLFTYSWNYTIRRKL